MPPSPPLVVLALLLTAKASQVPAAECAFTGADDPDGRERRRQVSRATVAFAASHPQALAARGAAALPPAARPSRMVPEGGGLPAAEKRIRYAGYVDEEVFGALAAEGIAPAPASSEAEFLRRVTLDLTGRIPDAATVGAFLSDTTIDKRNRMVDGLLASDAFVDR